MKEKGKKNYYEEKPTKSWLLLKKMKVSDTILNFHIQRRVSERVVFFKCLPPFLVNLNCFIVTKLIILSSICQTVQSNCFLQKNYQNLLDYFVIWNKIWYRKICSYIFKNKNCTPLTNYGLNGKLSLNNHVFVELCALNLLIAITCKSTTDTLRTM